MLETGLAVWGALLSTILAAQRLIEAYKSRSSIKISYLMNAPEIGGNQIHIHNISPRSLIIRYWSLELHERKGLQREVIDERYQDIEAPPIVIKPDDVYTLTFDEQAWFEWRDKHMKGRVWKLHLRLANGKSQLIRVFPD